MVGKGVTTIIMAVDHSGLRWLLCIDRFVSGGEGKAADDGFSAKIVRHILVGGEYQARGAWGRFKEEAAFTFFPVHFVFYITQSCSSFVFGAHVSLDPLGFGGTTLRSLLSRFLNDYFRLICPKARGRCINQHKKSGESSSHLNPQS